MNDESKQIRSDLVTSVAGRVIGAIYRASNAHRHYRIATPLMDWICRFEGGPQRSKTARILLKQLHEVEVGTWSYGPCMKPRGFPPLVTVGNFTSIASGVRIVNENHPLSSFSTHPTFYKENLDRTLLRIGNDVWIGYNAVILPGCTQVGDGAIIGAGAIVTNNVPPYAIVGGVPAKLIKYRFSEPIRNSLIASRWWETTRSRIVSAELHRLIEDEERAVLQSLEML